MSTDKSRKSEELIPYLTITLEDIPTNFKPAEKSFADGMQIEEENSITPQKVLIFYANLAKNICLKKQISEAAEEAFLPVFLNDISILTAGEKFRMRAAVFLDEIHAYLLEVFAVGYLQRNRKLNRKSTLSELIDVLVDAPSGTASMLAERLVEAEDDPDKQFRLVNVLGTLRSVIVGFDPLYKPVYGFSNHKFTYIDAILLNDAHTMFTLALAQILKEEIYIRNCKNCNSYFIASRKDEIYCDRKLDNGKTCKTMSYETRIKDSPILREYRKIYKTQHARKQRNMHRVNIESKFAKWKEFAEAEKQKCQAGEITLDEMIAAISSADWMEV